MTDTPATPEAPMDVEPAADRTLRLNEVAIVDVRRDVAAAVKDIDRALTLLREVLDTRLPELRAPGSDDEGERP